MDWSYRRTFAVLCFIKLALLITIYFTIDANSKKENIKIEFQNSSHLKLAPNPEITGLPVTCKLPSLNPWNREIMQFVDPDFQLETIRKTLIHTSLHNRTISVESPWYGHASCYGRCIFRRTETAVSYGAWKSVEETTFDCDLVHVTCKFYFLFLFPFNYNSVHSQIVPVKRRVELPKEKKYSIFVILIDSTAHGQANRNLPKTLNFMQKRFGAIDFPYSNKVAPNSRPNGFPLLVGKSIANIGNISADLDDLKVCKEPLDSFQTIFDDMREAGYRTLYSDDYPVTFYNQNCKGFNRSIVDHTLLPLLQEISIHNPKLQTKYEIFRLTDFYGRKNPMRILQLFDYFGNFVESYKDEPKFGWMWSSDLSHDDETTSIALDTMLYKFLIEHQEELDESFFFLMADHGLRFGNVLTAASAKLDESNPMLILSIPKDMRNSEVMKTVRANSEHLVTHYDTRATWLDIAKFQKGGFHPTPMKIEEEKGESYLRKQAEGRNCQNLPIPPVHCICAYEKEELQKNSSDAAILGRKVIADVNNYIAKLEERNYLCGKWIFAEVVSLHGVKPIDKTGVYYITVRAGEPYDKALFITTVSVTTSGELEVGQVDRSDRYDHRGDCSRVPNFCHCI